MDKDATRKWITAKEFAARHGLHPQTLANWRHADKRAGLTGPRPGYPVYRRFGGAIRYWVPSDDQPADLDQSEVVA